MRRSSAWRAFAMLAVLGGPSACNQISGVDELVFDLETSTVGGFGGAPAGTGGEPAQGGTGGAPLPCGGLCDQPPNDCFDPQGSCVENECVYTPLAAGSACNDGDPCTEGDACDVAGACLPGPECPNADPCLDVTCEVSGCVETVRPDGSVCGPLAANRCCGGACVDVSNDAAHCGGCGYACASNQICESVALTNQCSSTPANTTGRCTCSANSQCPFGQICRTQTPHPWRCTPNGPADCPGTTFVDLSFCPNYCVY
jgi:hypothetical protein